MAEGIVHNRHIQKPQRASDSCDVLKKQILNRNPRKEGIAFERKLNADGTYWQPEQYPKTSWVAAKGPPVDPSNLSGFTCESPHSSDESFDSNYKLFKN